MYSDSRVRTFTSLGMPCISFHMSTSFTINYAQGDQKPDVSFPNTPDLSRSHSYDSQASGHDSPLTPNSAYHEPLFPNVAGTMEVRTPTTPELSRRRSSNPYSAMFGAASSSSTSLDDFHYRHGLDTPHRQKRYPCKDPNCDKSFTTSGHASRHAKIHEGLKPISCTFAGCPKRFTRQDNMKQHLETHRREKSRASVRGAGRPSLASRRQSASSRGSISRFSSPRDTSPLLSPAIQSASLLPSGLQEALHRPSIASRTPSGLDALAMVAATESATEEAAQRQAEHQHYWRSSQY
ncbi:hypothetical protein M406DRAFT_98369 [Cryphonectria parasitica EP155]|uniref:C2H2 type master regulator of conidiophore development brlA n=1 Tax=Cryphonectria parasitica (strain ATCC 38755 / EP155) TaxID=660469 RepID=A0A9P4Y1G0_CRYP1|nr:uncharacterized protein M406DRAFT_98369 [Cryphonectria parasitica EP155]KAF3764768.1 hypothetical protein M406DRAFT_98369 [Cryphonectria parasitica EP155]